MGSPGHDEASFCCFLALYLVSRVDYPSGRCCPHLYVYVRSSQEDSYTLRVYSLNARYEESVLGAGPMASLLLCDQEDVHCRSVKLVTIDQVKQFQLCAPLWRVRANKVSAKYPSKSIESAIIQIKGGLDIHTSTSLF